MNRCRGIWRILGLDHAPRTPARPANGTARLGSARAGWARVAAVPGRRRGLEQCLTPDCRPFPARATGARRSRAGPGERQGVPGGPGAFSAGARSTGSEPATRSPASDPPREAEGEGFEPSIRLTTDNGFRDLCCSRLEGLVQAGSVAVVCRARRSSRRSDSLGARP